MKRLLKLSPSGRCPTMLLWLSLSAGPLLDGAVTGPRSVGSSAVVSPTAVVPPAEPVQSYIVTLRRGGRAKDRVALLEQADPRLARLESGEPGQVANAFGLVPYQQFQNVFLGFAVHLTERQVAELRSESGGEDSLISGLYHDTPMELHQAEVYPIVQTVTSQVTSTGFRRMGLDRFPLTQVTHQDHRVDIDIAVIDTGVDASHPDLNVVFSKSFAGTDGADGTDKDGHGTHVAGIIGAKDNEIGVVGVAPGARIWNLQVFLGRGGPISAILAALDFVVLHSDTIRVANCSFTTISDPRVPVELLRQATRAIVDSGVVLVASAGNDGRDIMGVDGKWGTTDDTYPAAFAETLAVTAMDDQDGLVGNDTILRANISRVPHPPQEAIVVSPGAAIDVCAPGARILSTYMDGQYALNQGTSMAAPHVSGLVGLYLLTHDVPRTAAGVKQVREALIAGAQPQSEWQTANTRDFDHNYEGLAVPAAAWNPKARILPWLTVMTPQGLTLRVLTQAGWRHRFEYSPLPQATGGEAAALAWSLLSTTNGTGSLMTVLDPGALTQPARLYRIRSEIE
jgi:hypothetical protein